MEPLRRRCGSDSGHAAREGLLIAGIPMDKRRLRRLKHDGGAGYAAAADSRRRKVKLQVPEAAASTGCGVPARSRSPRRQARCIVNCELRDAVSPAVKSVTARREALGEADGDHWQGLPARWRTTRWAYAQPVITKVQPIGVRYAPEPGAARVVT